MSKEKLQELINLNYSSYKIAVILNLSQTTVSYWLKKYNLKTNRVKQTNIIKNVVYLTHYECSYCKEIKEINKFYKNKLGKVLNACIKCHNKKTYSCQSERALKRKIELVNLLGGQCQNCGYNKNYSSLTFHHINPLEKKFELDSRVLSGKKKEDYMEEAKKCKLLCHNCHNELHHPEWNNPNYNKESPPYTARTCNLSVIN